MIRWAVALAVMQLVILNAGTSPAFELLRVNDNPCARDDDHLYWAQASAAVSTGHLVSMFEATATEARSRWNDRVRRFTFRGGDGGVCNPSDGVTSMTFSDATCDGSAFGDAIAITRSVWRGDGTIIDADIVFNVNSSVRANQAVFLEVAMHELGHILGLDHSDACGRSGTGTLMKSTLGRVRLDAPQADDVDGARFIYSSSPSSGGGVPEGANACAIARRPQGVWPGPPLGCIPPLLLFRWWRLDRAAGTPSRRRAGSD